MLFKTRYTKSLEASLKELKIELQTCRSQREADREKYERQIEILVSRLLEKHGVPNLTVRGTGATPDSLLEMDIFKDIEEQEEPEPKQKEQFDAFAR